MTDTAVPVVTAPLAISVEATAPLTSVVIGTATATDAVGVVSLASDAPVTFPVGTTVVTWTATDAAGNVGTASQDVTVADTTAPSISMAGANPLVLQRGTAYTEPGATAIDNVDGDVTGAIVTDNAAVDTAQAGSYLVTYTVGDVAGNSATATRTVQVVSSPPPVTDNVPPTVTASPVGGLYGAVQTVTLTALDIGASPLGH